VKRSFTCLLDIKDDGSIWMNQDYFKYATGLRMINEKKWKELFGFETRPVESNIEQHHCDLAYTIQQLHDEIVIKMAVTAKKMTGAKYLCLAGGSALNSVSNGKLLKGEFLRIFGFSRQPAMLEGRSSSALLHTINIMAPSVLLPIMIMIQCKGPT